ncbi:MAG: hypothetical protein ACKOBG_03050 [Actinomycetota bacterium]
MSDTTSTPETPEPEVDDTGAPEPTGGTGAGRPVIPSSRRLILAVAAAALIGLLTGAGAVAALDRDEGSDRGQRNRPGLSEDGRGPGTGKDGRERREQWRDEWRERRHDRCERRRARMEARREARRDRREARADQREARGDARPPMAGAPDDRRRPPWARAGGPGCGPRTDRPDRPNPGADAPGPGMGDEQPPPPPA